MTFAKWLVLVDVALVSRVGMVSGDLADWNWRDAYDDGYTPSDAVTDALADIL